MKRFFLSICFVTFLSAGLVSCADDASEVTPNSLEMQSVSKTTGDDPAPRAKP